VGSSQVIQLKKNRIGGMMVSVLALNAVDREFKSQSGQIKDYKILVFVASLLRMQL
jgi:hypothetical protein